MKTSPDGGEAIVEAFRKLEVDYILSSPGTEWAPVWEAMANQIEEGKNGPRLLDCWHETLAVDIAAGYTLATGEMQAVLLHAGSGLLQGLMGIPCGGPDAVAAKKRRSTPAKQARWEAVQQRKIRERRSVPSPEN